MNNTLGRWGLFAVGFATIQWWGYAKLHGFGNDNERTITVFALIAIVALFWISMKAARK